MQKNVRRGPISAHLDEIEKHCQSGDPTIVDILQILGPESHYAFMCFLILPFLQPIPLFGLSTPFGAIIASAAIFAYFNRPPWIPQKWREKKISAKIVLRITHSSEKAFDKLSCILHARWKFMFLNPFRALNTILLCANAIFLALPLPIPFSNAFPAWMIFLQTLAHLEEDGVFILLSYLQTILGGVFIFYVWKGAGFGWEALKIKWGF